jgi:hypothetical protein
MKPSTNPLLVLSAAALFLGAAALTALVLPMPTDAAVGPAGAGANVAVAHCQVRVAEAGRGFSTTLASLASAAEADASTRCEAYRAHVAALTGAREVYAACMSGFARDDQVAQLELAAHNWRSAIAASCGN